MDKLKMKSILEELNSYGIKNIDPYLPFPEPYTGKGKIKAIVLGTDPSTKDKIRFNTVFDLGGKDKRYFSAIEKNLNVIGLSLDNVYVQNFCQNYFDDPTYEQRGNWYKAAGIWHNYLKEELNGKFDGAIPVLATSELIFRRLINEKNKGATYYYQNPDVLPLGITIDKSDRKVFPFYRHWRYNLARDEWRGYREKLPKHFLV